MNYIFVVSILLQCNIPIEVIYIIYEHLLGSYLRDIHAEILYKYENKSLIKYKSNKGCNWLVTYEYHMLKTYRYKYIDYLKVNKSRNEVCHDNYLYNRSTYKRKSILNKN